jgi:hypothetical protein
VWAYNKIASQEAVIEELMGVLQQHGIERVLDS